jgi:hypothetical protein
MKLTAGMAYALALTLAQARMECKALASAVTECRLLADQTLPRYKYRVELATTTIFGAVLLESFEGGSWAEALAKAKARRPFRPD